MRIFTYIAAVFTILLGFTFASLNAEIVRINYYVGVKEVPLSLLLFIVLASGGVIGIIVTLKILIKLKRENIRLQSRTKLVERELSELRMLAVKNAN